MDGELRGRLVADGGGFVVTDEEPTTKADRTWDAKARDETPAGVAALIFDVVAGPTSAIVVTACTVCLLVVLWLASPLGMRHRQPPK